MYHFLRDGDTRAARCARAASSRSAPRSWVNFCIGPRASKEVLPASLEHGSPYEASRRLCASGGAMHELELYLTLSRCAGIEPGLYHYDPLAHELEHLANLGPLQNRLLADACGASGLDTPPDVLITLAARFQRVTWNASRWPMP